MPTHSHTTTVSIDGEDFELEVDVTITGAEPDVGLFGNGIDDWTVTAVNGDTSQSAIDAMHLAIEAEYGDEAFVQKLFDEDAAEVDYDDYPEYDDED